METMIPARTPTMRFSRAATAAVAAALLAALVMAPAHASAKPSKASKRPNVVLFVTDDEATQMVRPDTMPNLLNLIRPNATVFTNSIVTTPLCCPARAGMLTGQYGHNNGVLRNDYRQLQDRHNTLPVWLGRAGYKTAHVGKYLNLYRKARGPEERPAPGWDVWQTVQEPIRYYDYDWSANGRVKHYGTDDDDYLTSVINRKMTRVAGRLSRNRKPFYLQVDEYAPHDSPGRASGPCHTSQDPVPSPTEENLFSSEPLPHPPSYDEPDVSDKPSFIQRQPPVNGAAVARNYRCALAALPAVDRGIAMLHRVLANTGQLRKTVFIFTSDNGYFYGEHRLRYKLAPYDEALKVPLMISVPPRFRGSDQPGPTTSEPVANIDFAPTILDLTGVKPCRRHGDCRVMDGRSLMPLLRGGAGWPQDRALVIEHKGQNHGFSSCKYEGVRVPGAVFLRHLLVPDPATGDCVPSTEAELYDTAADPYELDNLYPAPPSTDAGALQERMSQRLAGLRNCSGIPGRDKPRKTRPQCE